jgi:hypothetical protein
MLYYVTEPALNKAFPGLVSRVHGVAFLEAYASGEPVHGDTRTWHRRTAAFYRRLFTKHGLAQCGPHSWLRPDLHPGATNLELMDGAL